MATGLVGEGHTVVTGQTPQPFRVEVLGVLPDYLGAGRDLIMIKVSDLPGGQVVSQGGGIWSGMSGSPVHVDGKLLGSVSYGFTSTTSTIGGLTPAADLLDLLDLSRPRAARAEAAPAEREVDLSASARQHLAAKAGTALPKGSLQQLATPLGVSGLSGKRVAQLRKTVDEAGMNLSVHASGGRSSAVAAAPQARPQAGGNFASVLSVGDVTAYGWGTTTAVCGDQAIAYGHSFDFGPAGPVSYGAYDAESLGIVPDAINGSFKMVKLGGAFGTVDQDRIAGSRADLTETPAGADVTTVIHNTDTGKSRTGTTSVLDRASLPGVVNAAVYSNQDRVFDEWNDGIARSDWTIRGTRAGGVPFTVTRANLWASRGDVTIGPANDVAAATDRLLDNEFEDVTINSVVFDSTMSTKFQQLHISKLEVKVNSGRFTSPSRLSLKAGDKLEIRVSLSPFRSTSATTKTLKMTVPTSARGQSGYLTVTGGVDLASAQEDPEDLSCLLFGECASTDGGTSLNAVIKAITSAPKNNQVVAELQLESSSTGDVVSAAKATTSKASTVTGERDIAISVRR
ncbi:SpoIVB peptidase S55 domain-containing protein [Microlunatus lacustris]